MIDHCDSSHRVQLADITPSLVLHAIAASNAAPVPSSSGITPFLAEHDRPYAFPGISRLLSSKTTASAVSDTLPDSVQAKISLLHRFELRRSKLRTVANPHFEIIDTVGHNAYRFRYTVTSRTTSHHGFFKSRYLQICEQL